MDPIIFPLYGSLAIQGYGLALFMGFILFWWLAGNNPLRSQLMDDDTFTSFLTLNVVLIILGGRIGDIIGDPDHYETFFDFIAIWQGGFSILGSTIAVAIGAPSFLYYYRIPLLPTLDLVTLYVPIMHIFGRLGCFIAGCCYGTPTQGWWSVIYTNPNVVAPLCIPLHPTQLYSVGIFSCIGVILAISWKYIRPPTGSIALLYLFLASFERFCVDFFRGDRRMIGYFSFHQWVALTLMIVAIAGLAWLWQKKKARYGYF